MGGMRVESRIWRGRAWVASASMVNMTVIIEASVRMRIVVGKHAKVREAGFIPARRTGRREVEQKRTEKEINNATCLGEMARDEATPN